MDATALHNFKDTIETLKNNGTVVITSGTNDEVFKNLVKYDIVEIIEEKNMHKTYKRAVEHAKNILNRFN
jgi:anti-anti-sigma regulatory factor